MRLNHLVAAVVLTTCSTLTWAHVHLIRSIPANGSTVTTALQKFVLTFGEPATLTALSVQRGTGPAQRVDPLPATPAVEISVPAPHLAPGKYVLMWRAVAHDGHVMPGKVMFTVGP